MAANDDDKQKVYDEAQLADDVQAIQGTDAAEDRAQLLINLQNSLNGVIEARDDAEAALNEANVQNTKLSKKIAELFTQITNVDDVNEAEDSQDLSVDDLM